MIGNYNKQKPHHYKPTIPYEGCEECGYGHGTLFHNRYEVERYLNRPIQYELFEVNSGRSNKRNIYSAIKTTYGS